jgi:hypothetical protein
MMATREEVYAAVDSERAYQQEVWGDRFRQPEVWCLVMEDYIAEARAQAARTDFHNPLALAEYLATVRKVTALGVACMEAHGALKRFVPAPQQSIVDTALVEDIHQG